MTRTTLAVRIGLGAAIAAAIVAVGAACGPDLIFRAYLGKTLWRPPSRYVSDFAVGLPPENPSRSPYAGMSPRGAGTTLQAARDAYRALFPDQPGVTMAQLNWPEADLARVRDVVNNAQASGDDEAAELTLLKCKVGLRLAQPEDQPALTAVRACFDEYLSRPRPDALASEARGWRARADFLLGNQAGAAKFYLDELTATTSNISRERLLASLEMVEPTAADLEEYFDTPRHALFIADRITNRRDQDALASALLDRLEQHRDLFRQGADSDALAVAMMRAATRMGAPQATLRYAGQLQPNAAARSGAEYNWLIGTARFAERDYPGAATAFMSAFSATDATEEERSLSANGLVGAYTRLNRPLDQLWAAFELLAHRGADPDFGFNSLDAAYLLDVQLSDAELDEYLSRFGDAPPVVINPYEQEKRTSLDAVRYELAVRHARREEYDQAARLYDGLHASRADKMREAATLLATTRAANISADARLSARYDYASFLADNENGLYFNDTLWLGFQTAAFVNTNQAYGMTAENAAALSDEERTRFAAQERRLQDVQEEYWKAYQILNDVVQQAGPTEVGKKAAARAVVCLRRISIERFGHGQEIRAADIRLSSWLARNK